MNGALNKQESIVDNSVKKKQSRVYVMVSQFGELSCCFSSQMKAYKHLKEHGSVLPSYQYFSRCVSKYSPIMWKFKPNPNSSYVSECRIVPVVKI